MKGQVWRRLATSTALLALVTFGISPLSQRDRAEAAGAIDGMVALINASSPTNDIYSG